MRMENKLGIRLMVLVAITALVGLWRVLSIQYGVNIWNFTPIGAMALFGGTYFADRYKSYLFPLLTLLISDMALMQLVYPQHSAGLLYGGWQWTYGSFLAMVWISRLNSARVTTLSFLRISFLAALAHYLISDLGVWLAGGMDPLTGMPYSKDWEGFLRCYIVALPFFRNILLGNLFFGALLFGGFEWAQRRFPALRTAHVPVVSPQ